MVNRTIHLGTSWGGGDTTTGLVSYWPMADEANSTTFSDTISGHNGHTLSPTMFVSDYQHFDGVSYSAVSDHADFNTNTLTVFGWAKGAAGSTYEAVFAQCDVGPTPRQIAFIFGVDGRSSPGTKNTLWIEVADDGTEAAGHYKEYYGSQTAFDNTWHSIAFRFNAGALDLFVDGAKDTSVTKVGDGAITTMWNSTASLSFGAYFNTEPATLTNFTGDLKKFRFYNVAKTDADILAIHNLGS